MTNGPAPFPRRLPRAGRITAQPDDAVGEQRSGERQLACRPRWVSSKELDDDIQIARTTEVPQLVGEGGLEMDGVTTVILGPV